VLRALVLTCALGLGACGLQFSHDRSSSRVAEYMEDWDFRVHRLALFHLPADRERSGIVRTRVVLRPDGAIESLSHVSSGDAVLDDAVLKIIQLATRDACRTGAEASCLRFPLAPAAKSE
jgi:hypothetical protein